MSKFGHYFDSIFSLKIPIQNHEMSNIVRNLVGGGSETLAEKFSEFCQIPWNTFLLYFVAQWFSAERTLTKSGF